MDSAVTNDIYIEVETSYKESLSNPPMRMFLFAYRITIENRSNREVQLISRHWDILDSAAPARIVTGPGVIGKQPMLQPTESFTYTSACDLKSEIGMMKGRYLMRYTDTGEEFDALIPSFTLQTPASQN